MSIPERFWTWWFDGVPQPVADRMFKRVVDEAVHKLADRLADENRTLREQVKELTRQRDDARALAARSGVFQCAACESAGQVCCVCLLDEIRGGGS